MKTKITFFILFCIVGITTKAFSQPKMKIDSTIFDFGAVEESNLEVTYKITNIGTQPLIIYQVTTGDGGLAPGNWPKDPILPGKRAYITLSYHGIGRLGPVNRTASISSNDVNGANTTIYVRGTIILKRTTIEVSSNEADIGTIPFGGVDTISFNVINTGKEPLHFNSILTRDETPIDLFFISYKLHRVKDSEDKTQTQLNYGNNAVNPKDTIKVQICLRNYLGNVGQKERHFLFRYNSQDSLKYTVKVNYTGGPWANKIYEKNNLHDNCLYEYENGKLKKHTTYIGSGVVRTISTFNNGDLIRLIDINPFDGDKTEYSYKNDLIIDKKVIKNKDKKN